MTLPVTEHQQAIARFRLRERRRWQWLLFFLVLTLVTFVLDVATGPSLLSPGEVVRSLLNYGDRDSMTVHIVRGLR